MKPYRIWPPLILIALIVVFRSIPLLIENEPNWIRMMGATGPLLSCLLILLWWIVGSRASGREKILGIGGIILAMGITFPASDPTMIGPAAITLTIPIGFIGFATTAVLLGRWLKVGRIMVIVAVTVMCFASSLLFRNEGMWGNGEQELRWRWTQTAEERLLAKNMIESTARPSAERADPPSIATIPEWPGFRGPNRDGRQRGSEIFSTNWKESPPREIWRIDVGPGWSSFAVAGDRIYTQEQRGPNEFVVCYEASSGRVVWTSLAGGRFNDPAGGPGPRATPEISHGNLFGLTAMGNLFCLDAATGTQIWKVDIAAVADREPPMWGFSSSPLVTDSLVIVYAGGEGKNGTLAFDKLNGDLKWAAPAGDHSYSSAQLSTLLGEDFVLMSTNRGLRLLNPETGDVRYFHDSSYRSYRTLQPHILGGASVLMQAAGGPGTYRLQLSKSGGEFEGKELWQSNWLKSDFNGCVVHQSYLYGFNGSVLVCLDVNFGELQWRGGRYGKGQILLLEKSGLLLVISERGFAHLVEASPNGHKELAALQIFEDKAWSHPVVVGDHLFLRNATQAVCYKLPTLNE